MSKLIVNGSNHHTRGVDMAKIREVQNREVKTAVKKHGGPFAGYIGAGLLTKGPIGAVTAAAGYLVLNVTRHTINTWVKNF